MQTDIEDTLLNGHFKVTDKTPERQLLLEKVIQDWTGNNDADIRALNKKYKICFNKTELRNVYTKLIETGKITRNSNLDEYTKVKAVRDQQGVIVITVVMSPYPNGQQFTCKYDCWYCPNVPGYSRSYYPGEPAVNRGKENDWDPINQVHHRIRQYIDNGIMLPMDKLNGTHSGYKVDFIVEGGTFTSYPVDYRKDFLNKLYYACNTFYTNSSREIDSIEKEQTINETSLIRIIGLSIETRPDTISKSLITEMRQMGVTRVQLGVQHLDDDILRAVNRQCYTKHTKRALKLLFDNCFKVAVHYMPDLPTSSVEKDLEMWDELFTDSDLEFDYVKCYPCMTMPFTEIEKWYQQGTYKPYSEETVEISYGGKQITVSKIIPVCIEFMKRLRKHHRLERMLRDLPVSVQIAGCDTTNLRQIVLNIMKEQKCEPVEIRHREVRDKIIDYGQVKMCIEKFPACNGLEYFISFETNDERNLLGFLRLRIPNETSKAIPELKGCALIREIHVYGQATGVNTDTTPKSAQHRGYGTKMLDKAIELAREHGFTKLAVISGVGVRDFYRKRGFYDGKLYLYLDKTGTL